MQAFDEKYNRILQLVEKDIFEVLSDPEREELTSWLSESTENRKFYENIRKGQAGKEYRDISSKFNVEQAWNHVYGVIARRRSRKRSTYYRVAAVLAVLFCSAIFGSIYYRASQQTRMEAFINKIQPATYKATLYIEGQERITIRENQPDTLLQGKKGVLHLNNTQLSYYDPNPEIPAEVRYNTLSVPRGGYFKILLADSTSVWVNSESELRFPEVFNDRERRVHLSGEAYFDVTPGERPFIVEFDNKHIQVLGTAFNVRSRKEDAEEFVTLAEGRVSLTTPQGRAELHPDQQAIVNSQTSIIEVREVDASLYTDWIRGKIIYRNSSLQQIAEDLGRWYNVKIAFEDQEIANMRFSLFVNRQDKISDILEILKETNRIDYKLSDNQILLTEN